MSVHLQGTIPSEYDDEIRLLLKEGYTPSEIVRGGAKLLIQKRHRERKEGIEPERYPEKRKRK